MSAGTSKRPCSRDLRAEPSPSVPRQHAMQPQQQLMGPSSMSPTTPTEASQGYHQDQLNLFTQSQSPATVQGGGSSTRQFIPASNVLFNPGCQSVQQNGTHFQPHIPSYTPYQPVLNGQNGHNSVATLTPSPDSLVQHGMDIAHPAAINQQTYSGQMSHNYSASQNFYTMHNPAAVPSVNVHTFVAPEDCLCGPNCNCLFCTSHPFNRATSERFQNLGEFLAGGNYWDEVPPNPDLSQPESETGNALTNGTHMEPAIDPMDNGSFTSNPLNHISIPEPTFDEGASVNDSDQSNESAHPQIKNHGYWTVGYLLKGKCTNTAGTCLCRENCACAGCHTHQGHVEYPDLSELPML